ncbi:IS3 family transposase [Crateriforma conspicua]|uniref:IS3 family transposase n=1 Tax=Crateriforma conspicua TaxID=2527996 RepID=UPI001E36BF90|nr:IS3 family transposase [Crateriforma conspicua]
MDQIVLSDGLTAARVCDVLAVSRSGFYAWRRDVKSHRELKDRELIPMIHEIYWIHRGRYGARRIAAELGRRNVLCGVGRVARLLKNQGLRAIQPKSYTPRTTNSRHRLGYDENLLADAAKPTAINQVWVGDITYIPIRSGTFGYCAVLMDLYSRRIVGWSYRQTMTEELVIEALSMAIKTRRPSAGLIHHSDRGGQYAGKRYRAMLVRASMSQSMSAAGNCYDNAFMESCFGTLKTELSMEDYAGHADALREIRTYVSYYNVDRIHSSLGYVTPCEFELQPQPVSVTTK